MVYSGIEKASWCIVETKITIVLYIYKRRTCVHATKTPNLDKRIYR